MLFKTVNQARTMAIGRSKPGPRLSEAAAPDNGYYRQQFWTKVTVSDSKSSLDHGY